MKTLAAAALMLMATTVMAGTDALSLIPTEAVTIGVVHFNHIRSGVIGNALFEHTDRVSANGEADRFLTDAGLDPLKDIDLLMVATAPRDGRPTQAGVVIVADGRFNVDRLSQALLARGASRKTVAGGGSYFLLPESKTDGAAAFPDARQAILGSESAVVEALAARARGGSVFATTGLGVSRSRLDPNATAWALVDVVRASRLSGAPHIAAGNDPARQALVSAVRSISTVGLWAIDSGQALQLGALGMASDAETLRLVEDAARGALAAMRLAVTQSQPDLVSILRRFEVERGNDSVRITGSIPAETLRKMMGPRQAAR